MKKQFLHIKNFVQDINLSASRGDKSDVLPNDLLNAEKRVELLKQTCAHSERKIAICLQSAGSGSDATSLDKRYKKMPETSLYLNFQEYADQLGPETVMGKTLAECADIQKGLSRELLNHELDIEKQCLGALTSILETDIPNVLKSRKQLNKATQDMDNYRQRYQAALKASHQSNGPAATVAAANKAEAVKKEWEEASTKVDQTKDTFAAEVFSLLSREPEFSHLYLQYFKLKASHHRRALELLEASVPKLEEIILNSSQKPTFGTPLDEHLRVTQKEVATVIETCIAWLLHNIDEEGLFRIPGSTSKVKKLKSSFDAGFVDLEEHVHDPHTVAGCLKSYLRELPEPLLTYALYPEWIAAAKVSDTNARLQALWQVSRRLPKANFDNLLYLTKFLWKLTASSESNKMSSQNIAIAMAPSLIWAPTIEGDESTLGLNMTAANLHSVIVDSLVNYAEWFFPGDIEFATLSLGNGNGMERSASFTNTSDAGNNLPTNKLQRAPKKPAPPAPPPPNNYSATNGSPRCTKGASASSLERKDSLTCADNNNVTLPRKTVTKPERPSIRRNANSPAQLNSSIDSSSNEAVDSAGETSSTAYATGSLDRVFVSKSEGMGRAGDRKSVIMRSFKNSSEKRSTVVSSPTVPRERPASFIERPSGPPPERPQRTVDIAKRNQSLENLAEIESAEPLAPVVSPTRVYPDLANVEKELNDSPVHRSPVRDILQQSSSYDCNGSADQPDIDEEQAVFVDNASSPDIPLTCKDGAAFASESEEDVIDKEVELKSDIQPTSPTTSPDLIGCPPEKPPRTSPPLRSLSQNSNNNNNDSGGDCHHHSRESFPPLNTVSNSFVRRSVDSEAPDGKCQSRPPRPLPPPTKPRFVQPAPTHISEASHL